MCETAPQISLDVTIVLLIFHIVLAPSDVNELMYFYLVWIVMFLLINIVWDIYSPNTPKFHFSEIGGKVTLLHPASFLCSSILIIVACINPQVWKLAEEIKIPILLTGISGILTSVSACCPYKASSKQQAHDTSDISAS
jgi:hypothetical protein